MPKLTKSLYSVRVSYPSSAISLEITSRGTAKAIVRAILNSTSHHCCMSISATHVAHVGKSRKRSCFGGISVIISAKAAQVGLCEIIKTVFSVEDLSADINSRTLE